MARVCSHKELLPSSHTDNHRHACACSAAAPRRAQVTAAPFRVTSACCFLLLAVAIGSGAIGIKRLGFRNARRRFLFAVSARAVYGVSAALAAIFATHACFDLLVLAPWPSKSTFRVPELPLQGDEDLDLTNFMLFLAWECVFSSSSSIIHRPSSIVIVIITRDLYPIIIIVIIRDYHRRHRHP